MIETKLDATSSSEDHDHQGQHHHVVDEPSYLFRQHQSYPVQEYLPTSAVEDYTSSTPSFILEVTWPRIALFYHPTSSLCLQIQSHFVTLARQIRHGMTGKQGMVQFWAVSCAVHEEACQELGIHTVPYLLGFPQGRIEGIPIPRTMDNRIDITWATQSIDVELFVNNNNNKVTKKGATRGDEEDETGDKSDNKRKKKYQEEEEDLPSEDAGSMTHKKVALHHLLHAQGDVGGVGVGDISQAPVSPSSHSSSFSLSVDDIFQDATSSLLYHLDQTISIMAVTAAEGGPEQRQQLYRQYAVLKEWFDLLHWTLPSRPFAPTVHDILNDLRTTTTQRRSYSQQQLPFHAMMKRILSSHGYYQRPDLWQTWKKTNIDNNNNNNNDAYCPVTNGFWHVLHIVSIGVVEQHNQVMGDLNRVSVRHAWEVMIHVVTLFGFVQEDDDDEEKEGDHTTTCKAAGVSSQKLLLHAYKDCMKSPSCRVDMGVDSASMDSSFYLFRSLMSWISSSRSDATHSDTNQKSWQPVAIWLWKVHNQHRKEGEKRGAITHKRIMANPGKSSSSSSKAVAILALPSWPSKTKCHSCYRKEIPKELNDVQQELSSSSSSLSLLSSPDVWLDEQEDVLWDLNAVYGILRQTYWPHGILAPRLVVLDRQHQYRQLYLSSSSSLSLSLSLKSKGFFMWCYIFFIALVLAGVAVGLVECFKSYQQSKRSKRNAAKFKKDVYDPFGDLDFRKSKNSWRNISSHNHNNYGEMLQLRGVAVDEYSGPRRRAWESLWR